MAKVKVLEVDQWTDRERMKKFSLEDFLRAKAKGPGKRMLTAFGFRRIQDAQIREVEENWTPRFATVWYRNGENGKLVFWKATYDSSG
jgi:hypothetical protein